MGYQAKFSRREGGGYDAAYGRGSKKLTAVIQSTTEGWAVTEGLGATLAPRANLRDLKTDWAALAEKAYADGAAPPPAADAPADPAAPTPCPPPPRIGPPPPRIGPPPSLRVEPTCPTCGMHLHGWRNGLPPCRCALPRGPEYVPDPFDPRMYDRTPGGGRHLSEWGALDLIYNWMLEYRDYTAPEGRLLAPWCHVRAVLQRKLGYAEYRDEVLGPPQEE